MSFPISCRICRKKRYTSRAVLKSNNKGYYSLRMYPRYQLRGTNTEHSNGFGSESGKQREKRIWKQGQNSPTETAWLMTVTEVEGNDPSLQCFNVSYFSSKS